MSWLNSTKDSAKREWQLYDRYHRHAGNIIIHAAAVPVEWLGSLLMMRWACGETIMQLMLALVGAYYLALALMEGGTSSWTGDDGKRHRRWLPASLMSSISQCCLYGPAANFIVTEFCANDGISVMLHAAALHLAAWSCQVGIGHWLLERNSPSIAGGLTLHAVALSPLLAWHSASGHIQSNWHSSLEK